MITKRLTERKWDVVDDIVDAMPQSRSAKPSPDRVTASSSRIAKVAIAIVLGSGFQASSAAAYTSSDRETFERFLTARQDRNPDRGSPSQGIANAGLSTSRLALLSHTLFVPSADDDVVDEPYFMD